MSRTLQKKLMLEALPSPTLVPPSPFELEPHRDSARTSLSASVTDRPQADRCISGSARVSVTAPAHTVETTSRHRVVVTSTRPLCRDLRFPTAPPVPCPWDSLRREVGRGPRDGWIRERLPLRGGGGG
ncbi:hypothetical protein C8Q80DRAFT_1197550 [Daedaleopsis nitida]|nr:hypothetical protein C8Q80DRAFT_1197550 [Daedaleopsis nitida]